MFIHLLDSWRFFRDYIYFRDTIYDRDEVEIVCRYPQFFATRLLKQSIIKDIRKKGSESIKIIAERYEECQYISKRKTRNKYLT